MPNRIDELEAALECSLEDEPLNVVPGGASANNLDASAFVAAAIGPDADATSSTGDRVVAGQTVQKDQPPCLGCVRTRLCPCYREPEKPVAWRYADKKGAWCDDCHRVWRTLHANNYSLAVYGGKMESQPDREQHCLEVLALNSLRRESGAQIAAAKILARADTIKFLCGLLGVSYGRHRVVLLEDVLASGVAMDGGLLSRALTTVTVGGVDRLGIMVPMPTVASASSFIKPVCEGLVSLNPEISCSSASDRAMAQQHLGGKVHRPACDTVAIYQSQAVVPLSKSMARARVQQNQAIVVMTSFCQEGWDVKAKESMFTPLVAGFAKIYAETCREGDGAGADVCQLWMEEMATAKKVMKLYREYSKSHYKHARLLAMVPDFLKFYTFMKKNITGPLAETFELMYLKIVFFKTVGEEPEPGALPSLNAGFAKVFTNERGRGE